MIRPVLLCGGTGTRLWPLSRKSYPKQFTQLLGEQSLFQASALRLSAEGYYAPIVVTADAYRFIATEQLAALGLGAKATVIEPESRNTAPAILAAALLLQEEPDALMLVAPSDHVIPDGEAFRAAIAQAVPAAQDGRLVTFGITPDRPETGYGYLELAAPAEDGLASLRGFVEKPKHEVAAQMLADGGYLWNAGIFLFQVRAILEAFEAHAGTLLEAVREAVDGATPDLHFTRLASEPWARAEATSIDYAIMEKATDLAVVPFSGAWSDLGDWEAVRRTLPEGHMAQGAALAIDCDNSLLRSDHDGQHVVGLGLKDIIAVAMPDAVLVADRNRAQEVRQVVDALRQDGVAQADQLPRDYRPWGWFESLAAGPQFQVKRITVNPGGALSLQSHEKRSEHWVVVEGTALVTVDDKQVMIEANQSVYVPQGAKHRLENPGDAPMVLIEVQSGSYFGEDDITRYDDIYQR